MSLKSKTASENYLKVCAYYYNSLQTLTTLFNHSNMIVHTWVRDYRKDCFQFLIVTSLQNVT